LPVNLYVIELLPYSFPAVAYVNSYTMRCSEDIA